MTSRNHLAVLAAAAGSVTGAAWASGQALQLVIKNTDSVPGLAGTAWATSGMFQSPSIDMFGNVGFRGTLLAGTGGVTTSNNATMWYGAPGSLSLAARTGFAAPGLSDGTTVAGFQSQNLPMSPNGQLWFGCTTAANPTPYSSGYLATGPAGSMSAVARRGETLPGAATPLISNPGQAGGFEAVNNAGQTVFYADLSTGGGVWVGSGAGRQLAYQTGGSYAGMPAGTTVNGPFSGYVINGSGTLLTGTQLTSGVGGVTDANNEVLSILPYGGSTFTTFAREGEVAPNSGGATYQRGLLPGGPFPVEPTAFFFGKGNFNNAGRAIYSAGLEGAGVDASNNAALYTYDGTAASLLRRRGDSTTAVTGATLAIAGDQASRARLNNNDVMAWTTSLTQGVGGVTASNDSVLLRTAIGGSDTLIAREGSNVPVLPGSLWGTSFSNLLQNNAGQMVFSTTLLDDPTDPTNDITTANDLALFAWDPTAGLMMIAREGDSLASIGINMTLNSSWLSMYTSANNDGGANALADNGWLTLRVSGTPLAGFTDNTAIVRTQIPAPGSAIALLVGGCAMLRRRTRR